MKAIHKYKHLPNFGGRENRRRIAQSLGYRITIHDMPHMIALLKRAGIEIETRTTGDNVAYDPLVDTITI